MRFLILLTVTTSAVAQDLPVPDRESTRVFSKDDKLLIDTEYKRLYENQQNDRHKLSEENEDLKAQLRVLQDLQKVHQKLGEFPEAETPPLADKKPAAKPIKHRPAPSKIYPSGVQTFAISNDYGGGSEVLPAGSWVRAKLLTGVEANSKYPYEVTLQLDYAFTGPNATKIPLQGCIMVSQAMADLSIERVIIRPKTLSCVRDDGEYVERSVAGFVAGKDSSNGLAGVYSSKQGKVFLAALLASIAKGAGSAVQMTQFSETASGSEDGVVARNFTGNVGQYAAAKGITDASTLVADWYLNQAKALLPTINVGSGQDVWVILTRNVLVPALDSSK